MSLFRVYIRPLELKDAEISYKWRNDSAVWEYTESKPDTVITQEIETQWLLKVLSNKYEARFAIMFDDKYVGNIQLLKISKTDAEYHIFIGDKDCWGKGVASLASYQILYFAKEQLMLDSIYLTVREDNIAAIKLYQGLAFFEEKSDNTWLTYRCKLENLPIPKVSVFVMVYNHEAYLKECLDGILMQQCNFNFDVVVGEDASTDNSRKILLDYQKNNPGKFKLLLQEKNIGAMANQMAVLNACDGKYVAMCEGDDNWTDPLKLQKQVEFLEANTDFSICFHKVKVLFENNEKNSRFIPENIPDVTTLEHLAMGNYIPTCSCVYRNISNPQFLSIVEKCLIGDYPIHLMNALNGKIRYFDENMASYRVHNGGIFESKSTLFKLKTLIDTLDILIGNFDEKVNTVLAYTQLNTMLEFNYTSMSLENNTSIKLDYIPKSVAIVYDDQKSMINKQYTELLAKHNELKRIRKLFAYRLHKIFEYPFSLINGYLKK